MQKNGDNSKTEYNDRKKHLHEECETFGKSSRNYKKRVKFLQIVM